MRVFARSERPVAAAAMALAALAELRRNVGRRADADTVANVFASVAGAAMALAAVVLTAVCGVGNLRWCGVGNLRSWPFGLGSGSGRAALIASTIHELTTERVRHQLEIGHATVTEPALEATR